MVQKIKREEKAEQKKKNTKEKIRRDVTSRHREKGEILLSLVY
jgi:hypothetical protein